jgi:hypothetical protein
MTLLIDKVLELINDNKQLNKAIFKYLVQNKIHYDIIETGCNFFLTELSNKQLLDIKNFIITNDNSIFLVDLSNILNVSFWSS